MASRLKFLLLTALLVGVPLAHAAKLYKWVDQDGNVSYQDRPPPSDSGYRVEEKNVGGGGASAGSLEEDGTERPAVVLYSAPKCASCDNARAYLESRGVPFTEKNVEGNRALQEELIERAGGLAVPTITIGSKVMRGYLESLLEGELDDAGYPKAGGEGEGEEEELPPTS